MKIVSETSPEKHMRVAMLLKMFKPIKIACSRLAPELRVDYGLVPQAQPPMRAAGASIHREADAAVRRELTGFDLAN